MSALLRGVGGTISPQQAFPHSCTHAALTSQFNLSLSCGGRGDGGKTPATFIIPPLRLRRLAAVGPLVFLPVVETSGGKYLLLLLCLQRGGGVWAEENDGGKVRGEPSRDFAKVTYCQWECLKKKTKDLLLILFCKFTAV